MALLITYMYTVNSVCCSIYIYDVYVNISGKQYVCYCSIYIYDCKCIYLFSYQGCSIRVSMMCTFYGNQSLL